MKKIILTIMFVLALASTVRAEVYWDDGLTHVVNDATYQSDLINLDGYIANQPGTHLEVQDGALINGISACNYSTVTINGGEIIDVLASIGNSTVTINGGVLNNLIGATENSYWYINGGSFTYGLIAQTNAAIEIRGGVFDGAFLEFYDSAKIYLYGYNFAVNGQAVHYGDILTNYANGALTGTLQNGTPLNTGFAIGSENAQIIIIPEPATLFLLTLGGLFLRKK